LGELREGDGRVAGECCESDGRYRRLMGRHAGWQPAATHLPRSLPAMGVAALVPTILGDFPVRDGCAICRRLARVNTFEFCKLHKDLGPRLQTMKSHIIDDSVKIG